MALARTISIIDIDGPSSRALQAHIRALFPDWTVNSITASDPFVIENGVVLLGSKLSSSVRKQMIASFLQRSNVAVFALLASDQDPDLHNVVRAGVHGVGFANSSAARLKKSLESAVSAWEKRTSAERAHSGDDCVVQNEMISNFPWLLEQLAANLESIAGEMRDGYKQEEPAAHSFQVKRAITGAIQRMDRRNQSNNEH